MKKLYIFALVAMFFAACTTDETQDVAVKIEAPDTIYATFDEAEADSRTYVEQGKYLRWNEGDEISFFPVTYNMQYRFKGKTGDNNGAFEKITTDLVTGNELKNNYAVYPYKASTAMSDEGIISFELPAVQYYAENSFGVGANTMVAITSGKDDNILRFKNCGGYLKLQLYGDATVKSIELKGNNGEKIAGASTITAVYGGEPSVALADSATTSIILDCGDGVALGATADAATAFWFVVPPTTFENGFTVTVTNTEGAIFEKSTSNTTTIDRNTIQPMAEVEVVIGKPESPTPSVPNIPNNEIWYTATAKVEPDGSVKFGANYLSSAWNETTGEGALFFDGDVTMIERNALGYSENLTSITLPQSVNHVSGGAFEGLRYLSKFEGKFASEDGHCLIVDGVLVSIACAGLSEYRLPDNIHSIADCGCNCMWFNGFERLIVPGSVETIGNYAFAESWGMKEFILEEGVKYIGDSVFEGMAHLQKVVLPRSIETIGSSVFNGNTNLNLYLYATTPPTINSDTFSSYYNVNIYLPAKAIPNYTNYNYLDGDYNKPNHWRNFLQFIKGSIEIPNFNNSSEIANNEIRYQSWDDTICPPYFSDKTDWGANIIAHRYNETLGCWVIMFDGDVKKVSDEAYSTACGIQLNLKSITLPNSITTIGKEAFVCVSFDTITIPKNVTEIQDLAFAETFWKTIYCTPDTPPTLGNNAFSTAYGDPMVERIYVPSSSEVAYKRAWLTYASYIFPYDF
uniref:leucine-rich repeat protein n=1 Tax=Alistipes sp. TaxID=1872444 RepID=UPI0040578DC3